MIVVILVISAFLASAGYLLWMAIFEQEENLVSVSMNDAVTNKCPIATSPVTLPVNSNSPIYTKCRQRNVVSTPMTPSFHSNGEHTPKSPGSGVYGLKGSRHSNNSKRSDKQASASVPWSNSHSLEFRSQNSTTPTGNFELFHTCSSFEQQEHSSSSMDHDGGRYSLTTPRAEGEKNREHNRRGIFLHPSTGNSNSSIGSGGSRGSKPGGLPPIEFTEVHVLDSDVIPHMISPSRFADVFVMSNKENNSCDVSSPLRECSDLSAEGAGSNIDGTRYERERQTVLMQRIIDKKSSFEKSQKQNLHVLKQTSAMDKNLIQANRSKSATKTPPLQKQPLGMPAGTATATATTTTTATSTTTTFGQNLSFQSNSLITLLGGDQKSAPKPAITTITTTSASNNDTNVSLTTPGETPVAIVASAEVSASLSELRGVMNAQEYMHHQKQSISATAAETESLDWVRESERYPQVADVLAGARNYILQLSSRHDAECTVEEAVETGSKLEASLQQIRKITDSSKLVSCVRIYIAGIILKRANERGTEEGAVLMMSHLLLCLCKDSKKSGQLIAHCLLRQSALCWPSLCAVDIPPSQHNDTGSTSVGLEGHIRYVTIFATLVASTEFSSIFRKDEGWSWLVRMGKHLHRAVKIKAKVATQGQEGLKIKDEGNTLCPVLVGIRMGCNATHKFLRICGRTLFLEYGPRNLEGVARGLREVCVAFNTNFRRGPARASDEITRLLLLTEEILAGGKSKYLSLKSQPPYVMAAQAYASALKQLRESSEAIDRDKSAEMKETKKIIGLQSLPLAFNIISSTQASQDKSIDSLITKINAANSLNDRDLLRYTIYKITNGAMTYCQTEHFDLKDSAVPLVRVVCNLCHIGGPSISAIFKMQFVSLCPFTIPKIVEEAVGDAFFVNMGFNTKMGENNKLVIESSERWLSRMTKLLGIYGYLCIQPEQNPIKYSDGWSWLSRIVNACSNMEGSPIEPTAKLLDTFLRVTSGAMLSHYGREYLELLSRVQSRVLPVLSSKNNLFSASAHKKQLEDFLADILSSNGEIIQPIL